jgi:hypothetical protein
VLLSNDALRRPVALFNAAMPCKCRYGSRNPECNWGEACRSFSMHGIYQLRDMLRDNHQTSLVD